ncbi:hypothetical protein SEVIR_4G010950v4 [Setaria viridis]
MLMPGPWNQQQVVKPRGLLARGPSRAHDNDAHRDRLVASRRFHNGRGCAQDQPHPMAGARPAHPATPSPSAPQELSDFALSVYSNLVNPSRSEVFLLSNDLTIAIPL